MSKTTREYIEQLRLLKTDEERYSFWGLIKEFIFNLIHIENKKFFYTAFDLTLRPGKAINKVMDGYRHYLFHPLEYLFICGAIIIAITSRYNFFANEFTSSSSEDNVITQIGKMMNIPDLFTANKLFFDGFFQYAEQYATIVNIVSIPIFSVLSYLFFWKYRHNFAENLIMNTYVTAQQLLFLVFLAPLIEFFPEIQHTVLIPLYTLGVVLYNIWVYTTFYEGRFFPKFVRSIFVVAIAFVIQLPFNLAFYYLGYPILKLLPEL
jgi:hypothetical protein